MNASKLHSICHHQKIKSLNKVHKKFYMMHHFVVEIPNLRVIVLGGTGERQKELNSSHVIGLSHDQNLCTIRAHMEEFTKNRLYPQADIRVDRNRRTLIFYWWCVQTFSCLNMALLVGTPMLKCHYYIRLSYQKALLGNQTIGTCQI